MTDDEQAGAGFPCRKISWYNSGGQYILAATCCRSEPSDSSPHIDDTQTNNQLGCYKHIEQPIWLKPTEYLMLPRKARISQHNLRRRSRVRMYRPGFVTAVTFPWYDQVHVSHDIPRQRLWTVTQWHRRRGADFLGRCSSCHRCRGLSRTRSNRPGLNAGPAPRGQDQK